MGSWWEIYVIQEKLGWWCKAAFRPSMIWHGMAKKESNTEIYGVVHTDSGSAKSVSSNRRKGGKLLSQGGGWGQGSRWGQGGEWRQGGGWGQGDGWGQGGGWLHKMLTWGSQICSLPRSHTHTQHTHTHTAISAVEPMWLWGLLRSTLTSSKAVKQIRFPDFHTVFVNFP